MKQRPIAAICLTLALVAAAGAVAASAADGEWTLSERDDDPSAAYALYRRKAPGNDFATWRIDTELAGPVDVVERVLLENLVEGRRAPPERRQELLRRDGDSFWVHAEIDVPMAADRDVVLRIERKRDPASGALRIEWKATPEAGPPPAEGVVRLTVSDGFWEFHSMSNGRTRALYESYAEPGGPFPSWLIDSMTSAQVLDGLEQLRSGLAEVVAELPPVAARSEVD
jgi:hypothetical protein